MGVDFLGFWVVGAVEVGVGVSVVAVECCRVVVRGFVGVGVSLNEVGMSGVAMRGIRNQDGSLGWCEVVSDVWM